MTSYRLPTVSPRKYRGKYPTRIHSVSAQSRGAARGYHFETNEGKRYLCHVHDVISPMGGDYLGKELADVLRYGTVLEDMMQEQYDAMLASVRAERE